MNRRNINFSDWIVSNNSQLKFELDPIEVDVNTFDNDSRNHNQDHNRDQWQYDDINISDTTEYENNGELVDPNQIDRHCVTLKHFYDARLYDEDIVEDGWAVGKHWAKSNYRKWICQIRQEKGWYGFHRPPYEHPEEYEDDQGRRFLVRKIIPYNLPGLPHKEPYYSEIYREIKGKNRNQIKPRVKRLTLDDEDYRAKIYTGKMGQEIARLRNSLDLTQAQLAMKINVDTATIRNIELGGYVTFNPQDVLTRELARALNVPSIKYIE